jgi:hypothetical protein
MHAMKGYLPPLARLHSMSAVGTFQTCVAKLTMSVHWGKADLADLTADFRK